MTSAENRWPQKADYRHWWEAKNGTELVCWRDQRPYCRDFRSWDVVRFFAPVVAPPPRRAGRKGAAMADTADTTPAAKAGRELDIRVVREVFGITAEWGILLSRRYSTSDADAMLVVHQMVAKGFTFKCSRYAGDQWHVSFWKSAEERLGDASADTFSESTCAAALAALAHEETR